MVKSWWCGFLIVEIEKFIPIRNRTIKTEM